MNFKGGTLGKCVARVPFPALQPQGGGGGVGSRSVGELERSLTGRRVRVCVRTSVRERAIRGSRSFCSVLPASASPLPYYFVSISFCRSTPRMARTPLAYAWPGKRARPALFTEDIKEKKGTKESTNG